MGSYQKEQREARELAKRRYVANDMPVSFTGQRVNEERRKRKAVRAAVGGITNKAATKIAKRERQRVSQGGS